jgi:hypothetical protein
VEKGGWRFQDSCGACAEEPFDTREKQPSAADIVLVSKSFNGPIKDFNMRCK